MKNNYINKKCKIFLSILITIFFIVISIIYTRQQKNMIAYSLIQDKMSYPILYAINHEKIEEAKKMLSSNLSNFVLNYKKDFFINPKKLTNLCTDWENGIKKIVLLNIQKRDFNNTVYQKNILNNIKSIDSDCYNLSITNQ